MDRTYSKKLVAVVVLTVGLLAAVGVAARGDDGRKDDPPKSGNKQPSPMPRSDMEPANRLAPGEEERLNWSRFFEVLTAALPHPGPTGNLNGDPEQRNLWRGEADVGVAALEWFNRRMRNGVPIEQALENDRSANPKHLAMVNVEAMNTRWVTNVGKFLEAADNKVYEDFRDNIADSMKPEETEKDAAKDRFKPKAGDGPAWVIEIRGYTDHAAGAQFVKKALLKNLQKFDAFARGEDKVGRYVAGAQDPVKGKTSHAFIYHVWTVNDAQPDSFVNINRSHLDQLLGGAPPGPKAPKGPGGGGGASELLGPAWTGLASGGSTGIAPVGGIPGVRGKEPKDERHRYEFVVMFVWREPVPSALPPWGTKLNERRPVPVQEFPLTGPLFDPVARPDVRKENPLVLPIGDFQVDLVRAPMMAYDLIQTDGEVKIGVLSEKKVGVQDREAARRLADLLRKRGRNAIPARPPFGPLGPGPGGPPGPGRPGGMNPLGGGFDVDAQRLAIEYVPLGDLFQAMADGKVPAMTVIPLRMVLIQAEIPYKKQIEEIKRALRLATTADATMWGPFYDGYEVQRRVSRILPEGEVDVIQDWAEYKFESRYQELINCRKLADVVEEGYLPYFTRYDMKLALPLPQLVKELAGYPTIRLDNINKTVEKLRAANRPKVGDPLKGKAETPVEIEQLLLRFLDVDVKPGFTYEYRIRLRMLNPNFKRETEVSNPASARTELLFSPWVQLLPLTLPSETFLYAADVGAYRKNVEETYKDFKYRELRNRLQVRDDQAVVEICTWMEQVRTAVGGKREPVGAWVVGDVPVGRGEFVGRKQYVKLPLWSSESKAYVLREMTDTIITAKGPNGKPVPQPRGWLVDFSTRSVLVDFEGGRVQSRVGGRFGRLVTEEVASELLIVRPDGKLTVKKSLVDEANFDRKQITGIWEKWVKKAEERKVEGGGFDDPLAPKPGGNPFDRPLPKPGGNPFRD